MAFVFVLMLFYVGEYTMCGAKATTFAVYNTHSMVIEIV